MAGAFAVKYAGAMVLQVTKIPFFLSSNHFKGAPDYTITLKTLKHIYIKNNLKIMVQFC